MNRYKNGSDRNQMTVLPMSLDDMITEDNIVRVLEVIVENMNIPTLGFKYSTTANTGRKPYDPVDMFKLYVYSYFNGLRSSRRIERECHRNIEVMWLINSLRPDHKTISEFRRNNKKAIQKAFNQFSQLCCGIGLVGKDIVAIDGSKFRASNSKDNYYSKGKVAELIKHYTSAAQKYLDLLDANDALPETEDIDSVKITEKLDEVKERLRALEVIKERVDTEGPFCTIDTDSKNMTTYNGGHDISFNVQIAVDASNHIVIAVDATNEGMDYKQLYKMSKQAKENLQVDKLTAIADKGYYSVDEFVKCKEENIFPIVPKPLRGRASDPAFLKYNFVYDQKNDVYICPKGETLTRINHRKGTTPAHIVYRNRKACKACEYNSLCAAKNKVRKITRRSTDLIADEIDEYTKQNKDLVFKRKSIVEHCFGIVKGKFGFSHFLTRGLESVRAESSMHFLVYNIKRMINIMGSKRIIEELTA